MDLQACSARAVRPRLMDQSKERSPRFSFAIRVRPQIMSHDHLHQVCDFVHYVYWRAHIRLGIPTSCSWSKSWPTYLCLVCKDAFGKKSVNVTLVYVSG
jgi:hypothetical protein